MPSRQRKRDLQVMRTTGGWAVKEAGTRRTPRVYPTQAEATKAAQEMLRAEGGEVKVQGRDGRWRASFTLGRNGMTRLNAVEGIRLSQTMQGTFREFDRRGLSADERREVLAKVFSKKR